MLDKTITFQTISQVLKKDILPNLTDEMAKEQTVALLAILKNLDANTVPSEEPFKEVNHFLFIHLEKLLDRMAVFEDIEVFRQTLTTITSQNRGERLKWAAVNKLFSDIIHVIYQNQECQQFIPEVRKMMREQLEIERKTVY